MSGTSPHDHRDRNPYGADPHAGSAPRWPDADAQSPYGRPPAQAGGDEHGQAVPAWTGQQATAHQPVPQWAGQPAAQGTGQPGIPGPAWSGQPAAPAAPRRPGSITAAFWLILSAGSLFLLTTLLAGLSLLTEAGRQALTEAMEQSYRDLGLTEAQIQQYRDLVPSLLPVMAGVTIALGVLAFLVYLLIALKIRGGSRAARTVGTVLAVLSVLMLGVNLVVGPFNPLELLWVALGAVGVGMAYRKDATEYLRLKAWERAARR